MARRTDQQPFSVERWDAHAPARRVTARRVVTIGGVVALLAGAVAVLPTVLRHTDSATSILPGPVERISVEADAGSVTVIGSSRADVRIVRHRHAVVGAPSPTTQWVAAGVLRVVGVCPGGLVLACRTDFRIEVPASSIVEVRTRSARVSIEGMTGTVDVESRSGDLALGRLGGASLVARTKTGAVNAQGLSATQVDVEARRDVTLGLDHVVDDLHVATDHGAVDVTVPDAAYRVQTDTAIGVVHIDVTRDPSARRDIDVVAPRGDIRVHP